MQRAEDNDAAWWNIKTSANYIAVSVAFMRKLVRQRRIPFVRVGSKVLRFRKQDLDRWLESSRE
jgi:excisionase family DNA binding protein